MKRDNLDFIDLKILSRLQEDGRTTNVELAESVDLSAPPCLRRVKALEERGIRDQLTIQRLKKKKLALKDKIAVIEDRLTPDIIA